MLEIVYSKKYIYQVRKKIVPGDLIMNMARPDDIPYRVRHKFTIKDLGPHRRAIVAHTPIDDAPPLEGVPLM